uniref:Plakophilin 3 n=2 Tax=Denticeps clupeoides TaxID=299321 RepID=A0AAY4E9P8_9TELE
MSAAVLPDGAFLSALPPNSAVTTYAVPPETQLGRGGAATDAAKAERVQRQVAERLATMKVSGSARQNGDRAASEYGGSSSMKYQTYSPGFSSRSYVFSGARAAMVPQARSQFTQKFSSRSAVDMGPRTKVSGERGGSAYNYDDVRHQGGGGSGYQTISGYQGGNGFQAAAGYQGGHGYQTVGGYQGGGTYQTAGGYQGGGTYQTAGGYQGGGSYDAVGAYPVTSGYQTLGSYQGGGGAFHTGRHTLTRSLSRGALDPETMSLRSLHVQPAQPMATQSWVMQDETDGSLISERDATFSAAAPQTLYSASSNGFGSGAGAAAALRQSGSFTLPMARQSSLSSTLARSGAADEAMQRQFSFKGPAHRTISRINTQRQNRMSMGSASGAMMSSGSQSNLPLIQRQASIARSMSMKSLHSVGKGMDIDGNDFTGSMGNLSGINSLDVPTAIMHLESSDPDLQVLGAAYIQHECYHNNESKKQVNQMKGIPLLVRLFTSENEEVQRYASGAARNLIYENMANKVALIEAGGIPKLTEALKQPDDELRKNITGILWNLSSKDNLKEKLARETLAELTSKILVPLSGVGNPDFIEQNASEKDIFFNTTGCLRNLSSVNEKTRQQMRETPLLVDALVGYIQNTLGDSRVEEKGVENAMCVLRNLSYQLYSEIPASVQLRLEGPTRMQNTSTAEAMGCYTPKSKKAKNTQDQGLMFTEVAREPKGMEWLWHPQVVGMYNSVLQHCEVNSITREAASGALQNITAGDKRWASVLSRVALEQERMLPVVLDHLKTNNDLELRSLTGFLRNLSRHARNKNDMATKVVSSLVEKLPNDGNDKEPSSDVSVNICGALNNLVTCSELAARDITYFQGLPKLMGIKNSHDSSPGKLKAAKSAATVLCNMFQYKKLHKEYKKKGYCRQDFADLTI